MTDSDRCSNRKSCCSGAANADFPHIAAGPKLNFIYSVTRDHGGDGPTAIYVASQYAPVMGPISVAAYSYMALVPIIQPPIVRLLTTEKASRTEGRAQHLGDLKLVFPIVVTIVTGLIAQGPATDGAIMLGNLCAMQCGRPAGQGIRAGRQRRDLFLGIAIGATMGAEAFLKPTTLAIFALGLSPSASTL
jgi:oxaloacetate decarboxylase beta subunit